MKWINQTASLCLTVCLGLAISAAAAPHIAMQPANQRTYAGGNVMFSVYSDSPNTLSYQWIKGSNEISGATDARLVLRNVSAADVDSYSVQVSDGVEAATSSDATLTVTDEGFVSAQPSDLPPGTLGSQKFKDVVFDFHGLALKPDGGLVTFGRTLPVPDYGSVDDFSYLPAGLTNVSAIAVNESGGMALLSNGTVRCWSSTGSREIAVPSDVTNVVAIAETSTMGLALKGDGQVEFWSVKPLWAQIPDEVTDAVAIAASDSLALVLRRDGSVLQWNQTGQRDGVPVEVSNIVAIAAGPNAAMVRTSADTFLHWRDGYYYGVTNDVLDYQIGPLPNVVEFTANNFLPYGASSAPLLNSDGTLLQATSLFGGTNSYNPPGLGFVERLGRSTSRPFAIQSSDSPVFFQFIKSPQTRIPGTVVASNSVVLMLPGDSAVISAQVGSSSALKYQWMKNGKAVAGATSAILHLVNAKTNDSGTYQVLAKNASSSTLSPMIEISVATPKLTINAPTTLRTTNETFVFEGEFPVGNDLVVGQTSQYLTSVPPPPPLGPNIVYVTNGAVVDWSWEAPLTVGQNTFRFALQGADASATITREITRVAMSRLTLAVEGHGVVVPNLNGKELEIGKSYTLQALPVAGYYFSGWATSDFSAIGYNLGSPKVSLTMTSNLTLSARFSTNPFTGLQGTYQGLVYNSGLIDHETSGYVTIAVSASGSFSGRLIMGGATYRFGGSFFNTSPYGGYNGGLGDETIYVRRPGRTPLVLQLYSPVGGTELNGTVSDGYITSTLTADKASGVYAGRYTVAFQGDLEGESPFGNGYATVTVDASGRLTMVGTLADGTPISQTTGVSSTGQWPLYVPLYNGKGSMISWVNFSGGGFNAPMSWIRPADPKGGLFSAGFTNDVMVLGSWYNSTGNIFGFTDGAVYYASEGGTLYGIDRCTVSAYGALSIDPASGDHVKINVNRETGVFSGSFVAPDNQQIVPVHGVILRFSGEALGYFLRTNQSGAVWIH